MKVHADRRRNRSVHGLPQAKRISVPMFRFQRIVVPLSLTDADTGLLRYASMVAGLGATRSMLFVHVVTPMHSEVPRPSSDELRLRMEEEVSTHFTAVGNPINSECHVVEGTRIDRLAGFTAEQKAGLILLGSRRARTRGRSLAERLAMISSASVWMVPKGSRERIAKILAPIDFSDHSADSLGVAAALARLQDLDAVEAFHVQRHGPAAHCPEVNRIGGAGTFEFREFLARTNAQGVYVDPIFADSNYPAEAILLRARIATADLIVMSTRGRGPATSGLLGSATTRTLADSTVPVLAVKHFEPHVSLFSELNAYSARCQESTNAK